MNILKRFAGRISTNNRTRKYEWFISKVQPESNFKILDVGFEGREYHALSNSLECLYPYPEMITALGLPDQDTEEFRTAHPQVSVVIYPGGNFPFPDNRFDAAWSNAVIEHVGNRNDQVAFVKELTRVSKLAFFTTPNRYFPIEVHTLTPLLHWFPQRIFDFWVHTTKRPWADSRYLNLLSYREIKAICKDAGAEIIEIKRNRFCGSTMDFCLLVRKI